MRKTLGKVLLLAGMAIAANFGARMSQEQIEEIMRLSQPAITHVMRTEEGEPPLTDENDQAFFT